MASRESSAFPDRGDVQRLQWYVLFALIAGGAGFLVLQAFGYLLGLPNPVPTP